jgi:hypothetical protein
MNIKGFEYWQGLGMPVNSQNHPWLRCLENETRFLIQWLFRMVLRENVICHIFFAYRETVQYVVGWLVCKAVSGMADDVGKLGDDSSHSWSVSHYMKHPLTKHRPICGYRQSINSNYTNVLTYTFPLQLYSSPTYASSAEPQTTRTVQAPISRSLKPHLPDHPRVTRAPLPTKSAQA